MPYDVRRSDACPTSKPWGVFKKGDDEPLGCHETEADADGQRAAINIREHEKAGEVVDPQDWELAMAWLLAHPDDQAVTAALDAIAAL